MTYYLQRDYNGQTEQYYHLCDEPYEYPQTTAIDEPSEPSAVVLNQNFPNPFNPMDAYEFMGKAWRALDEGGILLLEPYTFDALEGLRKREPVWKAFKNGPYSDKPYICLHESCWNDANDSLTKRWYIIDTETAFVRYFAQCFQAYTKKRLQKLLVKSDFINVQFNPSLNGMKDTSRDDFFAVSAVKTCNPNNS